MDIASILEDYLADVSTLPGDLAFILDEIKIKDDKLLEVQRRIQQKDAMIQKYVQSNGASSEFSKEQIFYPKIRSDFQECISLQQEKAKLATMGMYLASKHVSKLDNHVTVLEAEGVLAPVTQESYDSFAAASASPDTQLFARPRKATSSSDSRRLTHHDHSRSGSVTSVSTPPAALASSVSLAGVAASAAAAATAQGAPSTPAQLPRVYIPSTSTETNSPEPNRARVSLKRSHNSPRTARPPGEEGDEAFCFCKKASLGNMIACDGDSCEIEWFHWECVGLTEDPKGSWYCPQCLEKIKRVAR